MHKGIDLGAFLRDPVWGNFFGLAAIIIAVFFGIPQILQGRKSKHLLLERVLFSPLLSIAEVKHIGELKVTLGEREITETIQSCVMKLRNTGTQSVSAGDYVVPITFTFSDASSVLFATIDDASSTSLKNTFEPTVTDNEVVLPKILLNRGDWVTLAIIVVDHEGGFPLISYHIDGIPKIKFGDSEVNRKISEYRAHMLQAALIFIIFLFAAALIDDPFVKAALIGVLSLSLMRFVSSLTSLVAIFRRK